MLKPIIHLRDINPEILLSVKRKITVGEEKTISYNCSGGTYLGVDVSLDGINIETGNEVFTFNDRVHVSLVFDHTLKMLTKQELERTKIYKIEKAKEDIMTKFEKFLYKEPSGLIYFKYTKEPVHKF